MKEALYEESMKDKKKTDSWTSNIESSVKERYAEGANAVQEELCCPVNYDPQYLKVIPQEILDKDYGCGDPSAYVKQGDTVLDLGSGGGKICYIASQIVGKEGRVIGVDFNPAMLSLAEKHREAVGDKIGWKNVEFRRGRIQDLKTNLNWVNDYLTKKPIGSMDDYMKFQGHLSKERLERPLIESESIDAIVSNCVLNLVQPDEKKELFHEMYRVLKRGGRVAISDIVSDERVPQELQKDPELWSGCISGAFQEMDFLKSFEDMGFYGIEISKRDEKPWKVVEGIEFRSITVTAYKGKEGVCLDRNQAIVYKGPWKKVVDDDNHVLVRGMRTAVCEKTYNIYSKSPYNQDIVPIPPYDEVLIEDAKDFNCRTSVERSPKETKGMNYSPTILEDGNCSSESCC